MWIRTRNESKARGQFQICFLPNSRKLGLDWLVLQVVCMWGLSLEGRANAGQFLCINSYLKSDDWLRRAQPSRSLRIRRSGTFAFCIFAFAFMCILWHCMQVPTSRQLPKENLQPVCVMRELSQALAMCHLPFCCVGGGGWLVEVQRYLCYLENSSLALHSPT